MTDQTELAVREAETEVSIEKHIARMSESWPISESKDRFQAIALAMAMKDSGLSQCTMASKLIALNECCRLGLIPDRILGHVWLIPFRNSRKGVMEVQLIPGYKGYVELARRSGHLTTLNTDVVFANDEFDMSQGTNAFLKHRPWWLLGRPESGPLIAVWGVAKLRGEDNLQIEAMPIASIMARKARSHGAKRPDSPWNTDFEMMARKTIVRQMSKLWSLSPEQAYLQVLDTRVEIGEPQFEITERPEMSLGDDNEEAPEEVPTPAGEGTRSPA